MAQLIKKHQAGGTLTIGNKTHKADDDFINYLYDYSKTLAPKVANQFGLIINALKSGKSFSYDPATNQLTMPDDFRFDVTDRQSNRLQHGRTRAGSTLGDINNGREESARRAISALANVNYSKPVSETNWDLTELKGDYEDKKDDKGNVLENQRTRLQTVTNQAISDRLASLRTLVLGDNDKILKNSKDVSKETVNWIKSFSDEDWNALVGRINDGTWTKADAAAVKGINIILGNQPSSDNGSGEQTTGDGSATAVTARKAFQDRGLDYDRTSPYIIIGNNGEIYTTDHDLWKGIGENAIFNEAFRQHVNFNPDLDWLQGYTKIGNRLYRTSDLNDNTSLLYQIAHKPGGFYDLNAADKFVDADKVIRYLWGQPAEYEVVDYNNFTND